MEVDACIFNWEFVCASEFYGIKARAVIFSCARLTLGCFRQEGNECLRTEIIHGWRC